MRDARLVVRALRAVGAVFGAAAGLDREQLAELDFVGVVKFAMDLLCGENQVEKGPPIDIAHSGTGPIVAQIRARDRLGGNVGQCKDSWLPIRNVVGLWTGRRHWRGLRNCTRSSGA